MRMSFPGLETAPPDTTGHIRMPLRARRPLIAQPRYERLSNARCIPPRNPRPRAEANRTPTTATTTVDPANGAPDEGTREQHKTTTADVDPPASTTQGPGPARSGFQKLNRRGVLPLEVAQDPLAGQLPGEPMTQPPGWVPEPHW